MIFQHPKTVEIPSNVTLPEFVFGTKNAYNTIPGNLDADAFIDGDTREKLTHRQLRELTDKVASGLFNKFNLRRGDCIAIFTPNSIMFPIVFMGALSLGVIVTTINPMYTEKEVSHQLKDSKAKMIFSYEKGLEVSINSVKQIQKECKIVSLGKCIAGSIPLSDVYSDKSYQKLSFKSDSESKGEVALLAYSSGTTGLPKGVLTTHYNLISNLIQSECLFGDTIHTGLTASGILPFFHCYGIMINMLLGMHTFLRSVVIPKLDFEKFLGIIEKDKVELLSLAPPVILLLANSPLVEKYDLSSIKFIVSGAAPLPLAVGKAAMQRLGCSVTQGYGMTEASPVITMTPPSAKQVESVGILVPNVKAKIVDPESGKSLGVDEVGELWVNGPNIMKGYYNNLKATQDMFDSENYMRTGDVGYFDKNTHLHIVDRVKELIKYKGYQIAPAELEEVLLTHPKVKDCCVIGVPDKATGEELAKGFVVLDVKDTLNKSQELAILREIKEASHKKLAPYKHFRGGIDAIDVIPKSATGKILRRLLRDQEVKRRQAKL
ncbi:hypothetical protein DSO57_1035698 [Entomophthora muscae]|uniref:Uncharacterized protein n=1 Tax=Entomophthora muscae TaxID=34485 RepID=A0ACC2SZT4_9FUNG|nr:hypothetical protein DSO57_1035698 [Entomophthora muscae]